MSNFRHALLAAGLTACAASSACACATCGCSLTTDASSGYFTAPGWRLSLQYDDIDQNQLRHNNTSISAAAVAAINNAGGEQEVEHDTNNRYTTLGLSWSPNMDWSFRLLMPYIDRWHSTYGTANAPLANQQLSTANIQGLGDIRLLAVWQGLLQEPDLGLQLGVKLPTGHYGGPNAEDTGIVGRQPAGFQTGPLSSAASPDNLVDTSLQTGTGTTDLIIGAYYHRAVSTNIDAFVTGQYQAALTSRLHTAGEDFRTGDSALVSFGIRDEADSKIVPQLQINIARKSADQGALADNPDSAGTVLYLSPGVTAVVGDKLQAFAILQVPMRSHLAGYQLAPRWTGSAGLSYAF